ncbi:hypothetical protein AC578_3614 [Pseudocercospora eumusae]|uniref:C2H2 type master regulator of conidiophore development brlA n=1 Tax=Pseudocercospora eumusae TaxID=321146 RepID=A0A139HPE4_9PEZI|nr:hypothetical protein AC578_3614 [Pseudocercospora eumusae]
MTRFEESALRDSATAVAAEAHPSSLPYWHPRSHFSSLINPQHDGGDGDGDGDGDGGLQQLVDFTSAHTHTSAHAHVHTEPFCSTEMAMSPPPLYNVKTPTGTRCMRRPGLAGAAALVNGQYVCHWAVNNGIACRHKFIDAKSLNDHIRSQHVRGAASFVCQWSGCDKGSFPTANKLVRHVHSHTGYKPFPCPTCPQAFVTKDQLDKHVTTHTGAKDFVCTWPACGRSFAVKHALDGHMNSVHLKAKKHICPYCTQAFDDSSNLSKHKKQVHNPETGIKCPARRTHGCTYVDSRKDKMKEHCERECHGLETVTDPHAWNLWVQQFKSASKKAESRRSSSRSVSSTPVSRASSMSISSSTPFSSASLLRTPSIECSKQGCNIPVCLPCNILCNDLFPAHDAFQPCDDAGCDPCGPCHDEDCDPTTRQPCNIQPCTIPHCRSGTTTPSQPPTPYSAAKTPFYSYHGISGSAEPDPFQDAEHPFQLNANQLNDYMFMNQ